MASNEPATFIEYFLPAEEISEEARKEKNGRPPTFEMHYWWTRKPLIAARTAILGAMLPKDFDKTEFKKLIGLNKNKRSHNYDINTKKLKEHYKKIWGTKSPKILDPFAGGGSIPFEAMRMGAETYCMDYNPIAYSILKGTLEYPQFYGKELINDVESWIDWTFKKTKEELENLYPLHNGKEVAAYIYAWIVKCPFCDLDNPLVSNWWLVKKKKGNGKWKKKYLNPVIENNRVVFTIKSNGDPPKGTASGGKGRCIGCGKIIPNEEVLRQISQRQKERMLAVVLLGPDGKEYDLPSKTDLEVLERSKRILKEKIQILKKDDLIPIETPDPGEVSSARYLKSWQEHFNARQLLLLATYVRYLRQAIQSVKEEKNSEYTSAIATLLYFVFAKHVDYNCRTTRWHTRNEHIGDVMSFRRPSLTWDHAEVNPFVKSSGTLISAKKGVLDGLAYAVEKLSHTQKPKVFRKSVLSLSHENRFDIIVTDPPYYNDVQYGELSDFFYVWAKRILKDFDPEFQFNETPKSEEIDVSNSRHGSKEASITFFESVLKKAFRKIRNSMKENGILILFFAHSSPEAWDFVINTLQKTGFWITATWPVHTENINNPLARGKASIMSSILISARKRRFLEKKIGYLEEIQEEVESFVKKEVEHFWKCDMRGADLVVAAMGSALEKITQYSDIKSYSGDLKIKDILVLVQRFVAEHILSMFVEDLVSFDSPTSFYLYCRFNDIDQMPYDTANLIAKSLNMDLNVLEKTGLIKASQSRRLKMISINTFDKRNKIEEKYLIDAVHNVMKAYSKGGMHEFESYMTKSKFSYNDVLNIIKALTTGIPKTDAEKTISINIREGKRFSKKNSKVTDTTIDDYY
jgi:putative DNA methylase